MNADEVLRSILLLIRIEELKTGVPVGSRQDTRYVAKLKVLDFDVTVVQDNPSPFAYDWLIAGEDWSVAGKQKPLAKNIVFDEPVNPDAMARDAVSIKMCCDEGKAALAELEAKAVLY